MLFFLRNRYNSPVQFSFWVAQGSERPQNAGICGLSAGPERKTAALRSGKQLLCGKISEEKEKELMKEKRRSHKLLSLLLGCAVLIGMMPMTAGTAFAAGNPAISGGNAAIKAPAGDTEPITYAATVEDVALGTVKVGYSASGLGKNVVIKNTGTGELYTNGDSVRLKSGFDWLELKVNSVPSTIHAGESN